MLACVVNEKSELQGVISEFSYYPGIKALSENKFNDAADWFRVDLDTGEIKNSEYRWAYDRLDIWSSYKQRLSKQYENKSLYGL